MVQDFFSSPQTFSDAEIQTRGDLLDLPPAAELNAIHAQMADESIITSLYNFASKQAVKITEKKISVEEANKLYGTADGLVKFEEPQYPSVAKLIRTNKIQSAQRRAIIQQDAFDNDVGSMVAMGATGFGTAAAMDPFLLLAVATGVGGVAAGSLMTEIGTAGKMRNFVGAMEALSKTPGLRTATRIADGVHDATSVRALGGAFESGFARGSIPVALEELSTQPFVYQNAQDMGYDYDVLANFGFSLAAIGAVGTISGVLSQGLMNSSTKGLGKIFNSFEEITAAHHQYIDNALASGWVSESLYSNLLVKAHDSIVTGRPFNLEFVKAAMRLDDTGRATDDFLRKLQAGDYDNVFTATQKQEILQTGSIDNDFIQTTNFKKWATLDLDNIDGYARNADNSRLADELNLRDASLGSIQARTGKVSRLLNNATKRLKQIEQDLLLLNEEIPLRTGKSKTVALNKAKQLTEEKLKLRGEVNGFESELRKTQTLERAVMNGELESYFENARSGKRVEDMSFKEYQDEIKGLSKALKAKKYPDVSNFGKLTEETRGQLARLFYLANREDIYGLGLKDILQETDDLSLLNSYQKHLVKSQVEEMDFNTAADIIKKEVLDPDEPILKKLDEIQAKKEKQIPIRSVDTDDLDTAIEDYRRMLSEDDLKEFDAEVERIEKEAINMEEAMSEAIRCRVRAGL